MKSDYHTMSYECCKGCYTEPCEDCGKQLCPTTGHGEYSSKYLDVYSEFICHNCADLRDLDDKERYFCNSDSCSEGECADCAKVVCMYLDHHKYSRKYYDDQSIYLCHFCASIRTDKEME